MGLPWQIIQGDVRKVCKTLEEKSFDACFCDPPYGYSFMGRAWDYNVPSVNLWAEVLRVLKPGAHAMMFGGPRTFHRVACAIEDAGFELRDVCLFLHAKGFPKSLDVSKALDQRLGKSNARKVVGYKSGLKAVDGNGHGIHPLSQTQKVQLPVTEGATEIAKSWGGYGTALKPAFEPILVVRRMPEGSIAENVIEHRVGGIDIDGSRIDDAPILRWPANVQIDEGVAEMLDVRGGASRFFFTSKASTFERDAGIEGEGTVVGSLAGGGEGANDPVSKRFTKTARNIHPTVKPIDLIRYFAKMLLPPQGVRPRRILVPFSGSGSEMIGCLQAGWDEVIGIEQKLEYIEIAKQRISKGGVFSQLQDRKMRRAKPSRAEPSRAEPSRAEPSHVTKHAHHPMGTIGRRLSDH